MLGSYLLVIAPVLFYYIKWLNYVHFIDNHICSYALKLSLISTLAKTMKLF